jgi:hypothetical protein
MLSMLLYELLYTVDLISPEPEAMPESDGIEPEFGCIILRLDRPQKHRIVAPQAEVHAAPQACALAVTHLRRICHMSIFSEINRGLSSVCVCGGSVEGGEFDDGHLRPRLDACSAECSPPYCTFDIE